MTTLRLAGLVHDSIVDGPGLRCTVFVQGCPHACQGCHNPQSWPADGGEIRSVDEILAEILSNRLSTGLTLSGGEPTLQAAGCATLAEGARAQGLNVWCYTGFTWEALSRRFPSEPDLVRLMEAVDVLVDGPFVLARRSLGCPWRGSTNQRLIDVPASLAARAAIEIRDQGR